MQATQLHFAQFNGLSVGRRVVAAPAAQPALVRMSEFKYN
jgi:hypothetical protein